MISDKYKCVFVHIPKVAGQSVEMFFLRLHGLDWESRSPLLLRHNPDPRLGPERLAHLTAHEYRACGYLSEKKFNEYFKFSFVRNPWARLVSEYKYGGYSKKMDFRKFVISGLPQKDGYSDKYRHIIPQYEYLYHNDELVVDYVGRFENLQKDFDFACSRIGIENSALPHVNASNNAKGATNKIKRLLGKQADDNRHYSHFYDAELREMVGEIYKTDIAVFGYGFDS